MNSELQKKAIKTLNELHLCFSSWDAECCVLGNVKAMDAIDAINFAISAIHIASAVPKRSMSDSPYRKWV